MTKDEVLKLALEALETPWNAPYVDGCDLALGKKVKAITAIKEALAQSAVTESHKQEPVTWRYKIVDVFGRPAWTLKTPKSDTRVLESQPLYTTPPPVAEPHKRKPLTDEEIILIVAECASSHQHTDIHLARAIEAKLRSKNL